MASKLKRMLRKDPQYKAFKNVVSKCNALADFDNLTKEMENMHKARISRSLHLKTPNVKKVIKANMQANAFRSRTVEIMINVQKAQRTMEAAIERMETYISSDYSHYVQGRSIQDRKNFIRNELSSSHYKLKDYNRIVDMCELIVKDIDQFVWVAKSIMDGLSLQYDKDIIVSPKSNRKL